MTDAEYCIDPEEAVAAVFQAEGRDIKGRWDQRQQQLAEIRTRLAQIHERRQLFHR